MTSLLVMVRAWAHKCSDMSLMGVDGLKAETFVHWEEVQVDKVFDHPTLGFCFIGSFVCGIGAFNCHFPLNHVRTCNAEERDQIKRTRYRIGTSSFSYTNDEIADVTQLYSLPLVEKL